MSAIFGGKTVQEWEKEHAVIRDLVALKETAWFNPDTLPFDRAIQNISVGEADISDAAARLDRFRPYIAKVFPETTSADGLIESPVAIIPTMKNALEERIGRTLAGELLLKCDSHLPISGSIKARGGIYEVLKHAEELALNAGLLTENDNYAVFDSENFQTFFSNHSITVGSTGNLGLSIGIMGAQLGFNVSVHMSADARQWKKEMLRSKGVTVLEYESDYSLAVAEGRKQAENNPACYFIDDENSVDLFMGYAVAAERLKEQLNEMHVIVDNDHPLFVYLPCGVGGGPGGVAFGLKLVFGDAVHCFFAEPTHSPAMLLGMYTKLHDAVSVQDFGIDNRTVADGLAVGRPSGFVGKTLQHLVDGIFTVSDENMFRLLTLLVDCERIALEPSAVAGLSGMIRIVHNTDYLARHNLKDKLPRATHIAWATGGSMVPETNMKAYIEKGRALLER